MEGGDGEGGAAAQGELPQVAAQQERAAACRPSASRDAGRRAGQHRRGAVDADDGVPGADERQQQTPGAAGEVQHRAAALVGQRAVETDVVAPPPVFPVVERGVLERFNGASATQR